jgi:hypothetical protein
LPEALARLQGVLAVLEALNGATNVSTCYTLEPLPESTELETALGQHFAKYRTSRVPPQPASAWGVQVYPLGSEGWELLLQRNRAWFFERPEAPPSARVEQRDAVMGLFQEALQAVVGEALVYEVRVSPPMFYECTWEDFALVSPLGFWLLHLGSSD